MKNILQKLNLDYLSKFNENIEFKFEANISGGCINNSAKLSANGISFFIKWNSNTDKNDFFIKEINGLNSLYKTKTVKTPKPIMSGDYKGEKYLLMEFIEKGIFSEFSFENFGNKLALLHKNSNSHFGYNEDNYIGTLEQINKEIESWDEFFFSNRIEPLLKKATDNSFIDTKLINAFHRFGNRISEIFPKEPPALLHGDLWQGNYMFDTNSNAYIFDPAVYYGHREMDIAMSKLFGGFDETFYKGYNNTYALEQGWEKRIDYCNLYPLLVHLNLFGASYLYDIEHILKKF